MSFLRPGVMKQRELHHKLLKALISVMCVMFQKKKGLPPAGGDRGGSDRGSSYSTSSLPAAYGRLEPLPNSPLHREGLLKTPPLPSVVPPMKKFVK